MLCTSLGDELISRRGDLGAVWASFEVVRSLVPIGDSHVAEGAESGGRHGRKIPLPLVSRPGMVRSRPKAAAHLPSSSCLLSLGSS